MTETAHTPLPWKVADGADQYICNGDHWIASTMGIRGEEGAANAAFIVHAVNSHHDLIEALRAWKAAQQATDDAVEHYERAIAEGWWNEPGASLHVGASDRQAEAAWAHAIALRDAILTKAEAGQ